MRARMLVMGGLVALALVASGCAASTSVRVDEGSSGSAVEIAKGSTLTIALGSNPSTGYDWYLQGAMPSQLATVSDEYRQASSSGVVGAGGTHTFVYRANATGTGTLHLGYVRPWEKGVAPVRDFTITVTVQ